MLEGQAINGAVVALGYTQAQRLIQWTNEATKAYPGVAAVIHIDPVWYNCRRTIISHSKIRFTLLETPMAGTHTFVVVYGDFRGGELAIRSLNYSTRICSGDAVVLLDGRVEVEIAVKSKTGKGVWVAADIVYTDKDVQSLQC